MHRDANNAANVLIDKIVDSPHVMGRTKDPEAMALQLLRIKQMSGIASKMAALESICKSLGLSPLLLDAGPNGQDPSAP